MKIVKYLLLFVVIAFLGVCLRPVPSVTAENAQMHSAVVSDITEGGVKDAVFHTVDSDHLFYINRGLENNFQLEGLKNKLVGKEVTFTYVEHWTPLDWNNKSTHVAKLTIGEEVIYDEIKKDISSKLSYSN